MIQHFLGNYYETEVLSSDKNTVIKEKDKSQILDTGITTFTMAKNIYDISGNCSEYTQEAYSSSYRVSRGGSIMSRHSKTINDKIGASSFGKVYPMKIQTGTYTYISTRPVLYIKD